MVLYYSIAEQVLFSREPGVKMDFNKEREIRKGCAQGSTEGNGDGTTDKYC